MRGISPQRVLRVGLIAALVSGTPSTIHALVAGRDPLEATVAAGTLILDDDRPRAQLLLGALPVHLALSLWWAFVICRLLPAHRRIVAGASLGFGIALLDMGIVGRRFARVRTLPPGPQLADHVLFGVVVAALAPSYRNS